MDEERLVTLLGYENVAQAQFHFEKLEAAGIHAVIVDRSGEELDEIEEPEALPRLGGPVMLRVPESQAKRAGEILEEDLDTDMGGNPSVR